MVAREKKLGMYSSTQTTGSSAVTLEISDRPVSDSITVETCHTNFDTS